MVVVAPSVMVQVRRKAEKRWFRTAFAFSWKSGASNSKTHRLRALVMSTKALVRVTSHLLLTVSHWQSNNLGSLSELNNTTLLFPPINAYWNFMQLTSWIQQQHKVI